MKKAQLYFLSDEYFKDFPDDKLMKNKEVVNGIQQSRPCFFAFPDKTIPDILWLVPISSKTEKYKLEAQKKINKYGRCDTISFGAVLGREAAFLIQNMCPVIEKYITPYYDKNKNPIRIDNRVVKDIQKSSYKVLDKYNRGAKLIFPDVKIIYNSLKLQIEKVKSNQNQENQKQIVPQAPPKKLGIFEDLERIRQEQEAARKKEPKPPNISPAKPKR